MNTTATAVLRTAGLAIVLAAAIATGLIVGALFEARQHNAGYPIGWQPGPGAPVTRMADAAFSLEALDAVRAARGDVVVEQQAESDYHDRHPELTKSKGSTRVPDFVE